MRSPTIPPHSVHETTAAVGRRDRARPDELEFWTATLRSVPARQAQGTEVPDDQDSYDEYFLYDSQVSARLWDVIADDHPLGIELAAAVIERLASGGHLDVAAFVVRDAMRAAGMMRYRSGDAWQAFDTVVALAEWAKELGVNRRTVVTPLDRCMGTARPSRSSIADVVIRHEGRWVEPGQWSVLPAGTLVVVQVDGFYDHLLAEVTAGAPGEIVVTDLDTGCSVAVRASAFGFDLECIGQASAPGGTSSDGLLE